MSAAGIESQFDTANDQGQVTMSELDVPLSAEEEKEGTAVLGITIVAILILLPVFVCIGMKVIASKCPESSLGRKLAACKANNALTDEQMEMREA